MTLNEYQKLAMRTAGSHRTVKSRLDNAILGLCGEIGEFADHWKKHLFHNHDFIREHAVKELGDILWYIAQASDALGMDLEEIATTNIRKLEERYPEGFSSERSINRRDSTPLS
jgi:NTP pyrophosphatase (non-canonical NTP hydrolase)